MNIVVFEDSAVDRLYPITIGRPAYAISSAGYRLLDWVTALDCPLRSVSRAHLREIERLDFPQFLNTPIPPNEPLLLLNARVAGAPSVFRTLRDMVSSGQPGKVETDGQLAAALFRGSELTVGRLSVDRMDEFAKSSVIAELPSVAATLPLFKYPHDVVDHNLKCFCENMQWRLEKGSYREIADGVFVADGVSLGDHLVVDTSNGPVVIDEGAKVGPFCYISGPAYIGRGARIAEHAAIKDAVSLGHTTKIGGEVEASIVEPYTNKQHHGFLGHSYLGSWINLGAGTCNSDLKNTYGEVNMHYLGEKVPTNMQFFGCVMGDYAKTAINTGLFTGKTIGACSMIYGFVTTNVPSFVNYARLFGQVTELPPDVMVATQRRMFIRRSVEQRPCDVQLIHDMYDLSRDERQLAGDPLSL